jgi:putative acetyltransferase
MQIYDASTENEIALVRTLLREYADSIGVDLSFQGFESELQDLPGKYSPPSGGLFLATEDESPLGCVALRPLDIPGAAELKRLYVRPIARGRGVGSALTLRAIQRARDARYASIRLDTLSSMQKAQTLYRKLGFKEIPPYTFNPFPHTTFMELPLGGAA